MLVSGSAGEAALRAAVVDGVPGARSVAGEHDLPGLAAVVAGARLLVGRDTGVAHVAIAVATPSALLFSPTAPAT